MKEKIDLIKGWGKKEHEKRKKSNFLGSSQLKTFSHFWEKWRKKGEKARTALSPAKRIFHTLFSTSPKPRSRTVGQFVRLSVSVCLPAGCANVSRPIRCRIDLNLAPVFVSEVLSNSSWHNGELNARN